MSFHCPTCHTIWRECRCAPSPSVTKEPTMCYTLIPTDDDRAFLDQRPITDPNVKKRVLIERLVIRAAVQQLMAKGYTLQLTEGECNLSPLTRQWQVIMKELMACDEESLLVYDFADDGKPRLRGAILLVYGNDGWDVMADLSVWIDTELEAVNKLAEKIADSNVVVYS